MLTCWNDGAAKSAIVDFVGRVTQEGGADYVPPARRIATFDNDGTLSPLVEALDKADEYGITVVSMKRDWKAVFGSSGQASA